MVYYGPKVVLLGWLVRQATWFNQVAFIAIIQESSYPIIRRRSAASLPEHGSYTLAYEACLLEVPNHP